MAYKHYVLVCGGTGCESSKADDIFTNLKAEVANAGLECDVQVVKTGCFGFCEKGPIVKVLPEDAFYVEVKPEDAEEIVKETLVKGRIVKRLAYADESGKTSAVPEEIGFYQKQMRIVLRNCGLIDPEKIDEYIARDGYAAAGSSDRRDENFRSARTRRRRLPDMDEVEFHETGRERRQIHRLQRR